MRLDYVEAGQIVTTHGVRGELKVLPWLDTPEDLKGHPTCRISGLPYRILGCRVQNNCCLIRLEGIDTMDAANALRGKTLEFDRSSFPDGMLFAAEIIGMEVWEGSRCIGTVSDVLDYPGNMVYVVKGEHEYRIPAVKEFILSVDLNANRMDVRLLEGMREDED